MRNIVLMTYECECGNFGLFVPPDDVGEFFANEHRATNNPIQIIQLGADQATCMHCGTAIDLPPAELLDADRSRPEEFMTDIEAAARQTIEWMNRRR